MPGKTPRGFRIAVQGVLPYKMKQEILMAQGVPMKELFILNFPWVQRFAMLTNLVILNILWQIFFIPIVAVGAFIGVMNAL